MRSINKQLHSADTLENLLVTLKFNHVKGVLPLLLDCPQRWKESKGLNSFEGPQESLRGSAHQSKEGRKKIQLCDRPNWQHDSG